jgi:hypothetical protein
MTSFVKTAMFIFQMVMNFGNTSANVTDVTSKIKLLILTGNFTAWELPK